MQFLVAKSKDKQRKVLKPKTWEFATQNNSNNKANKRTSKRKFSCTGRETERVGARERFRGRSERKAENFGLFFSQQFVLLNFVVFVAFFHFYLTYFSLTFLLKLAISWSLTNFIKFYFQTKFFYSKHIEDPFLRYIKIITVHIVFVL